MKLLHIFILFTLLLSISGFSQDLTTEKTFYDTEWKVCLESKASFYRIVDLDEKGNPVGYIRDYYITGELQAVVEGAIYIDEFDDSNSIFTGKVVGYKKDGTKSFEREYDENGERISSKYYNENGRLESQEYIDKDGKWNYQFVYYYDEGNTIKQIVTSNEEDQTDVYISFHRNGEINRKINWENGEFLDRYFIECDEFGICNRVLLDEFKNSKNKYQWNLVSNSQNESKIIPGLGLSMKSMSETGFVQTIYESFKYDEDFSIECSFEFVAGKQDSGHGLMWGMKDWDNYKYFLISANGYYKVGSRTEGINLDPEEWTPSLYINRNYQKNSLKILKLSGKVFYSINGNLVHSEDFLSYKGNYCGFFFLSGEKNVLVKSFKIKREIDELPETGKTDVPWLGNGSGIFIGKEYIATNYHVIEDASDIEVEYIQTGKKYNFKATVIQSDKENDLSILKIENSEFKSFPLKYNFTANVVDVGTSVFALGYPMALSVMGSEIKFTDGKVSAKTGYQGDVSTYQTTTPIQPGNSGGPLFDYNGNLIGINSSGLSYQIADNVSYSIKTSYLKNLIDVLPENIEVPTDNSIHELPLTEQIKIISEYVVLIKVK